MLKGQLIWLNHLWAIQDQKCCIFFETPCRWSLAEVHYNFWFCNFQSQKFALIMAYFGSKNHTILFHWKSWPDCEALRYLSRLKFSMQAFSFSILAPITCLSLLWIWWNIIDYIYSVWKWISSYFWLPKKFFKLLCIPCWYWVWYIDLWKNNNLSSIILSIKYI